jgi:serine/threonine protein kinase
MSVAQTTRAWLCSAGRRSAAAGIPRAGCARACTGGAATAFAGRYRLQRLVGRGGEAVVYLARDEELDCPVALKVLPRAIVATAEHRLRFLREARIGYQLRHRNCVEIRRAGESQGRPYISMSYVAGCTLEQLVAHRGRLTASESARFGVQACEGLAHIHAASFVHRDIKPQNLLVGVDRTLKIADLGIACRAGATTEGETGAVVGTPAYLAPEQARGEPVTTAADVYALGAVLYELLTGRNPHASGSRDALLAPQRRLPITPLRRLAADVPPALEELVMACLAREPEERPRSAAALARELLALAP